jgi:signal transduction histidine kinase
VSADERIRTNLVTIDKEIDRLTRLINDILLLGKIEQSDIKKDKKKMDIVHIIQAEVARQNELNLLIDPVEVIIIGKVRAVEIDEIKFIHIVENLVSNAIKYSHHVKAPSLTIRFLSYHFEIQVKDHGIGIPYTEQSRVMDTFFRASNALNYKGTGIGMSIVKNFVELHEGQIRFTSEPGEGTEFIVSIPY